MKYENLNLGLFKYILFLLMKNYYEIIKEIIDHGLDNHLREVMLKLHKHFTKINAHHNLQLSKKLTRKSEVVIIGENSEDFAMEQCFVI